MNQFFIAFGKRVFSSRNLLFANGLLCIAYPLCYLFLVMLPLGNEMYNPGPSGYGVLVINLLFLGIVILTLNTILALYRQITKPRSLFTKIVFYVVFSIWLVYAVVSCCCSLLIPGFITTFYHFVNHGFRMIDPGFLIILSLFGFGMSYMSWIYYKRMKMKKIACFLVFTLLLFTYKLMLPHYLFITAWVFYGGYNFCIYYAIVDHSNLSGQLNLKIFHVKQDTIGPIIFENDIITPQ